MSVKTNQIEKYPQNPMIIKRLSKEKISFFYFFHYDLMVRIEFTQHHMSSSVHPRKYYNPLIVIIQWFLLLNVILPFGF